MISKRGSQTFVAFYNNEMVGYAVTLRFKKREPKKEDIDFRKVVNIGVDPTVQRQTVASQIMDEIVEHAKTDDKIKYVVAHTGLDTEGSRFFENYGFKVERIEKGIYEDPEEDAKLLRIMTDGDEKGFLSNSASVSPDKTRPPISSDDLNELDMNKLMDELTNPPTR